MTDTILHDHGGDGIDRRGFLKCMAWAGTGAVWAMQGGVLRSIPLGRLSQDLAGDLVFAQLSESHIGFAKAANPDVTATLPSTFCITWWMWPFSTVTEPNRRRSASACSLSSVPQPHSG